MEENIENTIPENVINLFLKKNENYPSITKTRNITYEGLKTLMVKNKRLWYNKLLLSDFTVDIEGVIEYGKLMVYYKRNKDENIYKLYILNEGVEDQTFTLLINGLKKFYTIN
jgi:hypothetical protein